MWIRPNVVPMLAEYVEKYIHRAATSRGTNQAAVMLALGSERETGAYILRLKFWIVCQYFGFRPSGCEPIQDVVNSDAQAAYAWLAATFARFHRNSITSVHSFFKGVAICPSLYYRAVGRLGAGVAR